MVVKSKGIPPKVAEKIRLRIYNKLPSIDDWVVVSNIVYFHPYLGKIPILTNIFQGG